MKPSNSYVISFRLDSQEKISINGNSVNKETNCELLHGQQINNCSHFSFQK